MSKADLTEKMHRDLRQHKLSKKAVQEVVSDTFAFIQEQLHSQGSFGLHSFGRFYTQETKEKTGTHPQTHEPLTIPACKRIKFKAASALQKKIR